MAVTSPAGTRPASVPATYTAAVVHDFEGPLTVEQVARRELEPGQVRVKVEASGLCHTDIHAAHGDWPVKPSPPFVPGHEGVGIVTELGPGVTEVAVGDRVAMPWLGYACGTCDYCVSGWETLCLEQKNMGYSIDGGFGEYAVAYGRYVVKVPDGRRSFRRCAADLRRRHDLQGGQGRGHALVGPRRRVRRGRARPHGDPVRGDRRRAGRRGRPRRREARARPRARRGVHDQRDEGRPGRSDPGLGGADQAIALAVSPRAFEQAYASLRRGGTLVFVALPADNEVKLPIFETVLNGITVVGSIVGTRADLREVFELHAAGKTHVIREVRPLAASTSPSRTSRPAASPHGSSSSPSRSCASRRQVPPAGGLSGCRSRGARDAAGRSHVARRRR